MAMSTLRHLRWCVTFKSFGVILSVLAFNLVHGAEDSRGLPLPESAASFTLVSFKKLDDNGREWGGLKYLGDTIRAPRDTLIDLIGLAYDVQAAQIQGAPEWASSARYDIVLSAPKSWFAGPFPQRDAQAQRMLRAMLAERFKLAVHHESGSMLAADLILAPSGLKMNNAEHRTGDWQGIEVAPGRLVGHSAPMSRLTRILALSTGQTVLDSTGLSGTYDFEAHWRSSNSGLSLHQWTQDGAAPPATAWQGEVFPSLEEALRTELGLVLEEPKRRLAQLIVIDRVEQPQTEDWQRGVLSGVSIALPQ